MRLTSSASRRAPKISAALRGTLRRSIIEPPLLGQYLGLAAVDLFRCRPELAARFRTLYRERWEVCRAALDAAGALDDDHRVAEWEGGAFLWYEWAGAPTSDALFHEALAGGVAVAPSSSLRLRRGQGDDEYPLPSAWGSPSPRATWSAPSRPSPAACARRCPDPVPASEHILLVCSEATVQVLYIEAYQEERLMPRLNVSFDAEQMRALQQLAAELGCSPAEMVRRAVDHYVATQLADDDAWRERLTDFLARVRGQLPVTVPPQEIESEITAAREEVRQAHRASGGR